MSGWSILVAGAVAIVGALLFLRVVAMGLHSVEMSLRGLEDRERRAYRLRASEAQNASAA